MNGQLNELNYIYTIASSLERFKPVENSKIYNFRCNICGDSHKSKYKARAYFVYSQKDDKFFFKCHNCGISVSFENYLKSYFPEYYKEFRLSKYLDNNNQIRESISEKYSKTVKSNYSEKLKNYTKKSSQFLFDFDVSEKCLNYVKSRMFPESSYSTLKYTNNFAKLIHDLDYTQKYKDRKLPEDERLILIFYNENKEIKGIQGRDLSGQSELKYITCMFDDNDNKIFGLDTVNTNDTIFVTEGALDSLFFENAISVNGGDAGILDALDYIDKSKFIIVFDNEPRAKDTMKRLEKAIKHGYKVVIWGVFSEEKDINDMIKSGKTKEQITNYILNNSYSGTTALIKFKHWKKYD